MNFIVVDSLEVLYEVVGYNQQAYALVYNFMK